MSVIYLWCPTVRAQHTSLSLVTSSRRHMPLQFPPHISAGRSPVELFPIHFPHLPHHCQVIPYHPWLSNQICVQWCLPSFNYQYLIFLSHIGQVSSLHVSKVAQITLKMCENAISRPPLLIYPFQLSFPVPPIIFPWLREVILWVFNVITSLP